jgi:peptidoglycan-N-acetylglucosamine deacetylase
MSLSRGQSGAGGRARLSVALTFDFDALSMVLTSSEWLDASAEPIGPWALSRGEYSATVVPRILALLQRKGIRATFFVPGHTAAAYPDLCQQIIDGGHEIGYHGWVHESVARLDVDAERQLMERAIGALEKATGQRPIGHRGTGGEFSPNTIDLMHEFGFVYDSSLMADDFHAYYMRKGDKWSTTEPYVFGVPTEIVEICFAWALDDYPAMEFIPGYCTAMHPASTVLEAWQGDFDWGYENCPGGIMTITMHPEVIGRGHRLLALERLLDHMAAKEGVVFERLGDYARRWKIDNPFGVTNAPDYAR